MRVRLTRELDMALTGKRHPYLARYTAGFDATAASRRCELALYSDGGWSLDLSEPIMWRSLFHCDNAYHLPAVEVTGRVCRTHKTSQTAFRGFGGPQGMLVIEEILSQAAQRLSIPAEVVRERNFYRDGDTHALRAAGRRRRPHRRRSGSELKETSDFDARRAEIDAFNARSLHVKRGLAITPVKFGISFTATFYNQARRARADLSRRQRAGESRRHRDGPGPVHQDPADRRRQLGVPLGAGPRDADAHRQGAEHLGDRGLGGTDLNGAAVADACAQINPLQSRASSMRPSAVARRRHGRRVDVVRRRSARRRTCSACRSSRRATTGRPEIHFDRADGPRQAVPLLRLRRRGVRGGGRRLHRRVSPAARPTSCRTSAIRSRRWSIAGRSKAASSRAWAG